MFSRKLIAVLASCTVALAGATPSYALSSFSSDSKPAATNNQPAAPSQPSTPQPTETPVVVPTPPTTGTTTNPGTTTPGTTTPTTTFDNSKNEYNPNGIPLAVNSQLDFQVKPGELIINLNKSSVAANGNANLTTCTVGFIVEDKEGTYILTAGHCGNKGDNFALRATKDASDRFGQFVYVGRMIRSENVKIDVDGKKANDWGLIKLDLERSKAKFQVTNTLSTATAGLMNQDLQNNLKLNKAPATKLAATPYQVTADKAGNLTQCLFGAKSMNPTFFGEAYPAHSLCGSTVGIYSENDKFLEHLPVGIQGDSGGPVVIVSGNQLIPVAIQSSTLGVNSLQTSFNYVKDGTAGSTTPEVTQIPGGTKTVTHTYMNGYIGLEEGKDDPAAPGVTVKTDTRIEYKRAASQLLTSIFAQNAGLHLYSK